jgi:two-component system cell cycle response regulator
MSNRKSVRRSLPDRPDLSQLKKQARSLHQALRAGSSEAFVRVAAQHPRVAAAGPTRSAQCRLSDAQLTIAREHGFASWPALAAHIAAHASLEGRENASNLRARAWTEQLFEPLALLARRVPWLSKPELVRLRQAGDWQGLMTLGEKLCTPHTQHTLDGASPELARIASLVRALSELVRSGRPEPQGASAATSMEAVSACLVVLYAAGYPQLMGQRFTLTQATTTLGRGEHNEITLHGDGISRSHARIEHDSGVFVLVDAGSTNGTFVRHGAERVERHTLRDGEQLLLGDAILVFFSGGDLTRKYHDAIAYISEHDALTRTGNRPHWLRQTEHRVLLARAEERPLSLLLLDVDHLARVNERVGQLGGNSVLSTVADVLRAELGPDALLGRTAGGQFGIALPGRDLTACLTLAERARSVVAAQALEVRGETLRVTLSVGAATLYRNTGSDELLEDAEGALSRAKAAGRDRVCA